MFMLNKSCNVPFRSNHGRHIYTYSTIAGYYLSDVLSLNHLIWAGNDSQDRAHRRWFELHFLASVSLGLSGPDRERWMFLDVVSGGRRVAGGAISEL